MKIEVSFQEKDSYLAAQIRGAWETLTLREAFQSIKDKAMNIGHNRILVDAFAISHPRMDMQRFTFGEDLAAIFRQQFRVAILYRPEFTNKFAETSAVNRGAVVRVCSSEDEALQWLLQGYPTSPRTATREGDKIYEHSLLATNPTSSDLGC